MAGLETTSAVNGNRILMGICLSYGVVSFCDTCRYHVFVLVALHSFSACGKMALNTLGATAFLMLLFKPVWLFDVGFQLSFSAVAAILLLQPGLYGLVSVKNTVLRKIWGLATVSVAAQVGTAPLVMFYFSRFSTHFLLTNLWVIPLVSLIVYAAVVLLVLTPFPGLQQVVADMVEGLVRVQNLSLRWIEQLPWASIDHVWVDMWDVVLFYFCLLLVCRVWARRTALNVYIALSGLLLGAAYHSYSFVADAPRRSIVFIMSADALPYIVWRIIPVHGWSAPTACPIRPICSVRFLPIGIACIWSALPLLLGIIRLPIFPFVTG